MKAFGLNRADTLQREGKYPVSVTSSLNIIGSTAHAVKVPPGVTQIMGLEFSGIVEEVGHGAEEEERHNWKKGDEVFGLTYGGAYAEYVAVNKKMLIRKPQELSWEVLGGTCEVN